MPLSCIMGSVRIWDSSQSASRFSRHHWHPYIHTWRHGGQNNCCYVWIPWSCATQHHTSRDDVMNTDTDVSGTSTTDRAQIWLLLVNDWKPSPSCYKLMFTAVCLANVTQSWAAWGLNWTVHLVWLSVIFVCILIRLHNMIIMLSCCLLLMQYELDLCASWGRWVSVHVAADICFQFARISECQSSWLA